MLIINAVCSYYSIVKYLIMSKNTDMGEDINPLPSFPESYYLVEQPRNWVNGLICNPCSPDKVTFHCPYSLRKTSQLIYEDKQWTVGDIVSVSEPNNMAYAQIVELYENGFSVKKAKIIWLAPKLGFFTIFKPDDYMHISTIDRRLVPIECLTFVMKIPNSYEYKKYVGNNYLVDTEIIPHADRCAPDFGGKGPPKQTNRGRGRKK